MTLNLTTTGAALLAVSALALTTVFAADQASAATHKAKSAGTYTEPSQPIAYSKLDGYLKASAGAKRKGAWGLDQSTAAAAATGTGANVSASAPDTSVGTSAASPATSMAPATQPAPDQATPDQSAPNTATPSTPDQPGAPATPTPPSTAQNPS